MWGSCQNKMKIPSPKYEKTFWSISKFSSTLRWSDVRLTQNVLFYPSPHAERWGADFSQSRENQIHNSAVRVNYDIKKSLLWRNTLLYIAIWMVSLWKTFKSRIWNLAKRDSVIEHRCTKSNNSLFRNMQSGSRNLFFRKLLSKPDIYSWLMKYSIQILYFLIPYDTSDKYTRVDDKHDKIIFLRRGLLSSGLFAWSNFFYL